MLVIHEFIECNFEDDFRFDKCLIRIYDIRYTLNMNHALMLQSFSISRVLDFDKIQVINSFMISCKSLEL